MSNTPIPVSALFANPANFFALGAGLGLSRKAPGTVGTLLGIPLLLAMPDNLLAYLALLVLLSVFGVWCCDQCSKNLGVHDHPGIVWDEVVGFLITMIAVPQSLVWIVLGFAVFRFFDILKPWPIGWIDKQVAGGLGIMLDDVAAGLMALATLHVLMMIF